MKTSRSRYRNSLAALILGLVGAVSAEGATVTVTSTADAGGTCPGATCTLRQAIAIAVSGDTINFAAGLPTITLTSAELLITKNLIISGPGANLLTIQRSASAHNFRIFTVDRGFNVTLSGLTITKGALSLSHGGGILNLGTVTIINSTISDNTVNNGLSGGGIDNDLGTVTIINSTLSGNTVNQGGRGGAIENNNGTVTITNSTISGNTLNGGGSGGGIDSNGGILTITNSTVSGNSTTGNGGGIWQDYNFTGGVSRITNCTITRNTAGKGGGVFKTAPSGSTVNVKNTIIADNTAPIAPDVSGAIVSAGYNLVSTGGTNGGHTGFSGPGDQVGTDAFTLGGGLSPLQDNGGPTKTHTPTAGSPAIDKAKIATDLSGQPISTDQRGQPRPVDRNDSNVAGGDGTDIGAVEWGLPQTGPIFTVTTTLERYDDCTTDDCSLLEALTVANLVDDANTINFAPGVTGVILNTLVPGGLDVTKPVTINGPGARTLTISGNNASRIFNIASAAGTVSISGLTLRSGRAGGSTFLDKCGGALLNAASLTLSDCMVRDSGAYLHAAGIYNNGQNGNAALTLVRCTLTGQAAAGSGGAIFNAGYNGRATLSLTNCTLDNNFASQYGAAIYNDGTSSGNAALALTNCTLSNNFVGSGAGGIYNDALNPNNNTGIATVFLQNTILAGGASPNLVNDSAGGGTITSQGSNLSSDPAGATGADATTTGPAGFLNAAGDKRNTDPKLDNVLRNNGGPTDTVALSSNSLAAINAGNDSTAPQTDQRGYYRNGVSDIGAFEFNGVIAGLPIVTTAPASNITRTSATLNASVNPNGLSTIFQFALGNTFFDLQNAGSGTVSVPYSLNVTGLTPNTQYRFNVYATNDAGQTQAGVEQTFTTLPVPTNLGNLSTRLRVEAGDDALFAGMIVSGTQPKRVIIRGTGTSLTVPDKLANPTLELHGPGGLIEENDNWVDSPNKQAIIDSGVAPSNDLEPAIIATLPAGNSGYTAILRGVNNGTGIGVIEVYDLDPSADSTLANISTRGLAQTGDNVLFAGTIVVGPGSRRVIVRAIAPSLSVSGKMADPVLQLFNQNGALLQENDNWVDSPNKQAILDSTIPPSNDLESAIVATLPGNNTSYTAIVRGVNNSTGIALVEVYALQ